jgi:hypothetical protein
MAVVASRPPRAERARASEKPPSVGVAQGGYCEWHARGRPAFCRAAPTQFACCRGLRVALGEVVRRHVIEEFPELVDEPFDVLDLRPVERLQVLADHRAKEVL